jgi:DNA-binding transcriptional LysR family regulator
LCSVRDELVLLVPPGHALAGSKQITMEEMGRQIVIAHNDPSPARDQVLRLYEQRHAPLNIRISLPSLDAIKRAVEMGLGVALLPRRARKARSREANWWRCQSRTYAHHASCASYIARTATCHMRRKRLWKRRDR